MLWPETDSRVNTGCRWKCLLLSLISGYKLSGFLLKRCLLDSLPKEKVLSFNCSSTHSLYSCFSQWYLQISIITYIMGCILLFQEHSVEKSLPTEGIGKGTIKSRVEYLLPALTFTNMWWHCCSKWYKILGSKVGILIIKNIL